MRLWVRERWTWLQRALDWPRSLPQIVQWSMQVTGHGWPCPCLPGLPVRWPVSLPKFSPALPELPTGSPAQGRGSRGVQPPQQALSKEHTQQQVAQCVPVTLPSCQQTLTQKTGGSVWEGEGRKPRVWVAQAVLRGWGQGAGQGWGPQARPRPRGPRDSGHVSPGPVSVEEDAQLRSPQPWGAGSDGPSPA